MIHQDKGEGCVRLLLPKKRCLVHMLTVLFFFFLLFFDLQFSRYHNNPSQHQNGHPGDQPVLFIFMYEGNEGTATCVFKIKGRVSCPTTGELLDPTGPHTALFARATEHRPQAQMEGCTKKPIT